MRAALGLAVAAALVAGAAHAADPPKVVATSPANGAIVPASTPMIAVTYDRQMSASWSFTGDPSLGPMPEYGRPTLSADGRTISAPVKLKPGSTYVVWLNSERYKGFKDIQGRPAAPHRLTFTTSN